MKNRSIQKELDNKDKENNNKEASFVKGLEQVQYNKSLYIVIFQRRDKKERGLNVYTNKDIKQKKLQFKILVNLECIYIGIEKQLVREE